MKKYLSICCFLFLSVFGYGQVKQKAAVKTTVSPFKKMLTGTGLPFQFVNDSLAIVPFEGVNMPTCHVMIQGMGDLYIVTTNLSETFPGKLNESTFKYLLQRNYDFDFVKIGMDSEDNAVYLRIDVFKSGITVSQITRIIKQVGNVANIIGGDLK